MSFNAAALKVMADKGLSIADVIEIAEAMEKKADRTAAARQARHRARRKKAVDSNAVTVTRDGFPNEEDILTPPNPPVISYEMTSPGSKTNGKAESLKPEHVIEAWNEVAERHGLPVIRKLTEARQKHLRSLIRKNSIEEVRCALDAIERSPFLRGENDRGWRADFDFLLQPKSFTKLIEGAYDH